MRVDEELWLPRVPLTSIIHVLEGRIAIQPMFGYRLKVGWGGVVLILDLVFV